MTRSTWKRPSPRVRELIRQCAQRVVNPRPEWLAELDATVIKPGLVGGWTAAEEWIALADARGIGWWVTSALESNIGLNAIAQWAAMIGVKGTQGLGTGSVFLDNIPAPLEVERGALHYRPERPWHLSRIID